MPRTCTICCHEAKLAINALIAIGKSYRNIAAQFGIAPSSIARHVKACIPQALEAARLQTKAKSGFDIERELQNGLSRLNKLIDACDEWLTDPDDKEKYNLEPRDLEMSVIYLDPQDKDESGNSKRKRDSLRRLIAKLEDANYEILDVKSEPADPRELLVKTAAQIAKYLELYGKLRGSFQRPNDNDTNGQLKHEETEQNRRWVEGLIRQIQQEKKLSEPEAENWLKENVPTALQLTMTGK